MSRATLALVLSGWSALAFAQTATVPAVDARVIYSGSSWRNATICEYNDDGTLVSGQPGCYNLGGSPCADSFMLATTPGATASLTFKGTGISLHTLTQPGGTVDGLITITMDSDDRTLQSFPVEGLLKCPPPIFVTDGLDPGQEHKLTVVLRQPPATNVPNDETMFLAIKEFVITGGDAEGGGSGASSNAPTSTTGTSSASGSGYSSTTSATSSPGSSSPSTSLTAGAALALRLDATWTSLAIIFCSIILW